MSDTPACEKFELDQSTGCLADSVGAVFPGGAVFRQRAYLQPFTFESGYLDPDTGDPVSLALVQGYATEFRLDVSPTGITTTVKCLDAMRLLMDRNFRMLFLRAQPAITEIDERTGEPAVGGVPFLVGDWWASSIATAICDRYGLKCQWQCPNYLLRTDFSGVGRPADLLRQLTEPFQSLPAFAVDIFAVADTIYVRQRTAPLVADPNCTLSVRDARISRLSVGGSRGPTYGLVTLLGMYGQWQDGGMIGTPMVYDYDESTSVPTKDEHGSVTGIVVKTTTYRSPLKLVIAEREQTFSRNARTLAMELVKEELTTNAHEDIVFRGGVPNQPKRLSQTKANFANVKFAAGGTYWAESKREVTSYGYNAYGYQEAVSTKKLEINTRLSLMEVKEVQVKTLKETSQLETEQSTSTYKPDKTTGILSLQDTQTQRSAGLMPAGPKPPMPITAGSGDENAGKEQIRVEEWIDDSDDSVDVNYSNLQMTADDLQRILAQYEWASGKWQYELSFDAVAMPWLRKGSVLQLTGLLDSDGTAIPLAPAIVEELRGSYDEGSATPSSTISVTARWWA